MTDKNYMKAAYIICFIVIFLFSISGQESTPDPDLSDVPANEEIEKVENLSSEKNPDNMDEETEIWDSNDSEKSDSEIISIVEERRSTLKYGIDKSVLEVLKDISDEKSDIYNQDILQLLQETENPDIQVRIFDFFSSINVELAEKNAVFLINELLEDQDIDEDVIISAISYLGELKKNANRALLYSLLDQKNQKIIRTALNAVGKLEPGEENSLVRKLVFDSDDDEISDETRNQGILTLGELKDIEAGPPLIDLIKDDENDMTSRQYACIAVGKINYTEGIDDIIDIYNNSDSSQLRSYAISGLSWFQDEKVDDVLTEAAKRDSYWQIRVNAINGIQEREMSDTLDMLVYKSKSDPELNVKKAALKAIGSFNNEDSNSFLLEYFDDEKISQTLRLDAVEALIKNQYFPVIDSLLKLYEKNKEKDFGRFLEFNCLKLSTADWPELKPVYEKMLTHENYIIKIYAVRGIKRNAIDDLYESVRQLNNDKSPNLLRREIKGNF